MCSLSGFRPPLFSEDDAWLPAWLQQCHYGQLNVEGSGKDNITFEQRVEEFQFLEKGISIGESMRDEGECNISRLFISGPDSSPFSSAQLDDNVDQLRLFLSYDTGNSNDTTLTAGANWLESNGPLVIKALQKTTIISQKDAKLTMIPNADAVDWSPAGDLEKSAKENELLRRDIEIFSEDHVDAIELCVAASEALVINEAIESDKFIKPSASAILETSLQVKQARLELLTTFSSATSDDTIEMDSLSDLDDLIMESAYEDAGIHLDLLPGNKLSVSQVKDTFESESYDNLENDIKSSSAMSGGKSCNHTDGTEGVMVNEIQSRNDIAGDCVDVDMRKEVIFNPEGNLAVGVGDYDDCFRTIDEQARAHLSREAKKTTEDKSHETNSSFPIMRYQDGEKSNDVKNIVKERFQSRWLGGWTTNNEATCLTTAKHSIANPFAGETSFLSESADAPADENSVMQAYHHKATIIASQIQSLKFLYGCAVHASVLKVDWLIDSIAAGYVLPPKRYAVLFRNTTIMHDQVYTAVNYNTHTLVFNNVGVMLHGKTRFFSNIATIIEHGGGQVFRTLQRLNEMLEAGRISMGVVVSDENCASHHFKQCAMEQNITMTSVYWIIKSLYAGKLVPLEEKKHPTCLPNKLQMSQDSNELSQEI